MCKFNDDVHHTIYNYMTDQYESYDEESYRIWKLERIADQSEDKYVICQDCMYKFECDVPFDENCTHKKERL